MGGFLLRDQNVDPDPGGPPSGAPGGAQGQMSPSHTGQAYGKTRLVLECPCGLETSPVSWRLIERRGRAVRRED